MIFKETKLKGAYSIDLEKREDDRGFFARIWCRDEFSKHGLNTKLVQGNMSYTAKKGTLRGLHYQVSPFQETKVIRCTRGALFDVIIDMRSNSPTFKQWIGVELSASNYRMLYVPEGFAHGFVTLQDDTEATYLVTEFYNKESERGIRYNDPSINIQWPIAIEHISEKDNSWPDLT